MELSTHYPGNQVMHGDYAVGYLTAALKAGVSAVRTVVSGSVFGGLVSQSGIPVEMEYPDADAKYPYIHVAYRNKKFEPASLNELREALHMEGSEEVYEHYRMYRFEGEFAINIYATTILERETISDAIISMIGMDEGFRTALVANPYINIAPNMHALSSPTANESVGAPEDKDIMTCFRQFTFPVYGEFYMRVGNVPQLISKIDIAAEMRQP